MNTITVRGAPAEYVLQTGVLKTLDSKLLERGFSSAFLVHGTKSWQAAKPYWPECTTIPYQEYTYHGECSFSEIELVKTQLLQSSSDVIIGVGGGKVLDLVKAAAHAAHKPYVLIPTLASNCSAWTPISVIYTDEGQFARFDIYPESASLLLIDPQIALHAPVRFLKAGIGDTLAKWYEADVQLAVIPERPASLEISYFAAHQCKNLLRKHAAGAVESAAAGKLSRDFLCVMEAIIVYGGMVGGFGDAYGRIAGAHAIHNGLTAIPETHQSFHGEKVAYGILVQLVLEQKFDEITSLLPFYDALKLPHSLHDMNITEITPDILSTIAEKSVDPAESIHVMPIGPITKERVIAALEKIESISKNGTGGTHAITQ